MTKACGCKALGTPKRLLGTLAVSIPLGSRANKESLSHAGKVGACLVGGLLGLLTLGLRMFERRRCCLDRELLDLG
ncbi:MAG TPA: hypothetical protein VFK05_19190 [Polyangiaceae bacterium]|nr:hypothetical protein [Polyangiaceae bacterium]